MTISEVGIFARSFPRRDPADIAQAVRAAGFTLAQFSFAALGQPTLNPGAQPDHLREIASAFRRGNISIGGLSATYNAIHPDPVIRAEQTRQAARLIGLSPLLGVHAVTVCTGIRDRDRMWEGHPDNCSAGAWHDLRTSIDALLPAAAAAQVQLGIEPEPGKAVRDAQAACQLLRELGGNTARLGIILDPGNLITPGTLDRQRHIFAEAFDLLGAATIALHAKDLDHGGPAPLGRGGLDWDLILGRAQQLDRHLPTSFRTPPRMTPPGHARSCAESSASSQRNDGRGICAPLRPRSAHHPRTRRPRSRVRQRRKSAPRVICDRGSRCGALACPDRHSRAGTRRSRIAQKGSWSPSR